MRTWAVVLLGAAVLAGCTGEQRPVPLGDVVSPTASASATPTPPADPYAVPDEITPEYVERVYAALAELESEAIVAYRDHVENGGDPAIPPQESIERFRAIYSEAYFPARMTSWAETASSDRGFSGFRRPMKTATIDVSEVLVARASCVVVVAILDLTGTAASPAPTKPSYFVFLAERSDGTLNPTPWQLRASFIVEGSGTDPASLCND